MLKSRVARFFWIVVNIFLLFLSSALAGAKEDLSITGNGACSAGGTAFVITNTNTTKAIHATVSQSTQDNTTVTAIDVTLQPNEQKALGCSSRGQDGDFLTVWQVQSAQYQ